MTQEERLARKRALARRCDSERTEAAGYRRTIEIQKSARSQASARKQAQAALKQSKEEQLEVVRKVIAAMDGALSSAVDRAKRGVERTAERYHTDVQCSVGAPALTAAFGVRAVQEDTHTAEAYADSVTTRRELEEDIAQAAREIRKESDYITACDKAIRANESKLDACERAIRQYQNAMQLL